MTSLAATVPTEFDHQWELRLEEFEDGHRSDGSSAWTAGRSASSESWKVQGLRDGDLP